MNSIGWVTCIVFYIILHDKIMHSAFATGSCKNTDNATVSISSRTVHIIRAKQKWISIPSELQIGELSLSAILSYVLLSLLN